MPRTTYGLPPKEAARLFHALGHEHRVRFLLLLAEQGESSMGELHQLVGRTYPNTSKHLGVLRATGLAESRRDGRRVLYRLSSPVAADLLRLVRNLPMPRTDYGRSPAHAARLFGALGHATRVRILLLLAERGEAGVGDLQRAVGRTQINTSAHLGVLRRAGVVECRRDGMRVLYRLASPPAADVLRLACGP
jgi:ArsR family transcriptional regulator